MVKCANCGYLSVRSKIDYGLAEPATDFRERGTVAIGYDAQGHNQHSLHEPIPLCLARQSYLIDATKNIKNKGNPFEEVKAIIQKDMDCKGFAQWQQGFTPKEHREMADRRSDRKWHWVELGLTLAVGATIALIAALVGRG